MKKKQAFGTMAIYLIWILLTILSLNVIWTAIFAYKRQWIKSFGLLLAILLLDMIITGISIYFIRRKLILPYMECRILFRHFIHKETYRELMDNDYQIFEEQKEVLNRFDYLLDKKNAIRVSTKQAELLALQNQINPHFLYNTLEAIRGDALCAGLESIADTTEALSTFFRYTITETGNLVSLEDELENVENYFKIQKYRFGEKLSMEIHFSENDRSGLQWKLPKLTLQPIVENAIFHGLESKAEGGKVSIYVETTRKKLLISVRDNGVGISEENLEKLNHKLEHISVSYVSEKGNKRGGIALENVCRRIKLLFGEEYGLHVYSVVGFGTHVQVSIPLIKSKEGVME